MTKLLLSLSFGVLLGMSFWLKPLHAQSISTVKNFSLISEEDTVSLNSFKNKKAVVVVFTSSHCSWATKYEERLHQLHDSFSGKDVAFLAINSNDASMSERDDATVMRQISPYPFPYMKDENQVVAKLFKATKTPEVFLLQPKNGVFTVMYQGKIDDNPLDPQKAGNHYLFKALQSVLAGEKPATKSTFASGCNIR